MPSIPTVEDFLAAWEDPPAPGDRKASAVAEPRAIYNTGGANYQECEARNQSQGEAGERFVMNLG